MRTASSAASDGQAHVFVGVVFVGAVGCSSRGEWMVIPLRMGCYSADNGLSSR